MQVATERHRAVEYPLAWHFIFVWLATAVLLPVADAREPSTEPTLAPPAKAHPLDAAIQRAQVGLDFIRENVDDYTCTIVKRERISGKLQDHEYILAKIRNRKLEEGKLVTPFAVYLKFMKPDAVKGREVIWVEGKNGGKLIAHEGGLLGFTRVPLQPVGFLAMMGQRYPITNIGLEKLIEELIVRAQRDRQRDECEVKFYRDAKVDERPCTKIEVVHPQHRPYFDFHRVEIYIDEELQVPVRYASWSWPKRAGDEAVLEEEYTYRGLKLNVGLTDKDFDPDNPEYDYP